MKIATVCVECEEHHVFLGIREGCGGMTFFALPRESDEELLERAFAKSEGFRNDQAARRRTEEILQAGHRVLSTTILRIDDKAHWGKGQATAEVVVVETSAGNFQIHSGWTTSFVTSLVDEERGVLRPVGRDALWIAVYCRHARSEVDGQE